MKVILLQNIDKLGKKNDVKEVADGYGRNFLIPRGLAVLATASEMKDLEEKKKLEAEQAEKELGQAQEIAAQIDGMEIDLPSKASPEGKLFGTIKAGQISDRLKELGFEVAKKQVKLIEPIKEVGDYEVAIEFPHNLEVKIKVSVYPLEQTKE